MTFTEADREKLDKREGRKMQKGPYMIIADFSGYYAIHDDDRDVNGEPRLFLGENGERFTRWFRIKPGEDLDAQRFKD